MKRAIRYFQLIDLERYSKDMIGLLYVLPLLHPLPGQVAPGVLLHSLGGFDNTGIGRIEICKRIAIDKYLHTAISPVGPGEIWDIKLSLARVMILWTPLLTMNVLQLLLSRPGREVLVQELLLQSVEVMLVRIIVVAENGPLTYVVAWRQ